MSSYHSRWELVVLCFCFVCETGSHSATLAALKLTVQSKLGSNAQSFTHLCFLSAEIKSAYFPDGVCYSHFRWLIEEYGALGLYILCLSLCSQLMMELGICLSPPNMSSACDLPWCDQHMQSFSMFCSLCPHVVYDFQACLYHSSVFSCSSLSWLFAAPWKAVPVVSSHVKFYYKIHTVYHG